METIEIQAVSDIVTSKGGREYFTFEDNTQKRYVCFIPKLNHFIQVGSGIEADITPGKTPQDSPRLDMIYVNGKPVIIVEKKTAGRSYGKSDKELAQIKQLAEAQNRSIQAQTALNRATDLAIAIINQGPEYTAEALGKIGANAKTFYQLLQSLTLISEAEVLHKKIKEAKSETTKDDKGSEAANQSQVKGEVPRQDSRETAESDAERVSGFLKYLEEHGKNNPRLWLDVEYGIPQDTILTPKKCELLYKAIKTKEKW